MQSDEQKAKRGRGRRRSRGSLAHGAARALADLAGRLVRDPAVCTDGPPSSGELLLRLSLADLQASAGDPAVSAALAEGILAQIVEALRDASRAHTPLQVGRALCLRCREGGCDHARPTSRSAVFIGYAPNGTPRWDEFTSRCLALDPGRAARLYGPSPQISALVHPGAELCRDLLPEFGGSSPSFRLLAQLDFGLLTLREERVAASVQILRLHPPGAQARTQLHIVGLDPRELEVDPAQLGGRDPGRLLDLLRSVRQRAPGLAHRAAGVARNGAAPPLDELAQGLLNRLRSGLERTSRQRSRRTLHAGHHSEAADRPLEMALRDARYAGDDALLVEPRRATCIVLGPRGRVHVFSESARLVTSLKLDGDAVRRRRSRGRWQEATPEQRDAFRQALRQRLVDPRTASTQQRPGDGASPFAAATHDE